MSLKDPKKVTIEEIRQKLQAAFQSDKSENLQQALDELTMWAADQTLQAKAAYDHDLEELRQEMDAKALAARGVRQLTGEERQYYQRFAQAAASADPRQAVTNLDVAMPKTIIDSVFQDLETRHPLLSKINFTPAGTATEIIVNTNGYQEAAWGDLCDEIVRELSAGFKKITTNMFKLSAFMKICKAMLDLGPEWLDSFIRRTMYEAFANGLESGIVAGDGNKKPVGMIRQVGDSVVVTGGVYPKKNQIKVNDLSPATLGNLVSIMAADPNGNPRQVMDLIFLVNPQDYFQKVMPATTLMAPDGTYRNDVLAYPMTVIQTPALKRGEAVLGPAGRYLALAGSSTDGRIEYSDQYHFLEDERVYLIKGYANGMPLDNNAFLFLDISGLRPATWKVTQVEEPTHSTDATLSGLTIGSLQLTPAFSGETLSYTASTTNATNTVTAVPAEAGAEIHVLVNNIEIDNGTAATWQTGTNTVKINVTAADGAAKKSYTVTVTKNAV